MAKASDPRSGKYLFLASFVVVSIATSVAADSLLPQWRFVSLPLHAGIEFLGGLSSVIIGMFLLERPRDVHGPTRLPLATGFIGMGILDVFHGIALPGQEFVLLRSVSSLVAGSCFAFVWLPDRWSRRLEAHERWIPGATAAGVVTFAVWTHMAASRTLPVTLSGNEFSGTSIALNTLAGGLFLAAAVRLLGDFHRSGTFEDYVLACMATMFGLAGALFSYSALWDYTWWLWHLLRGIGACLALLFAFREYTKTLGILRTVLAQHERTEARLRDSEILYRTLFEQSPDGILVIDPATTLPIEFNDTAARQLGYSRDEFARLRISDYEAAESAQQTARHVEQILSHGHDSFESRHRTKQGSIRTVLITVGSITLSGRPALHCIFKDVTELHEQSALARLGEMAAVVAHEVKNPLAGIRGAIQIIGRRMAPGHPDAAVIGEIIARIDALDDLMKDILIFARPPQVQLALVDVVALAQNSLALLKDDPAAHRIRVEVDGGPSAVMADAKLLNIVLLNLFLNSAHAMQNQGTIRLSVATEHHTCRITVADTGPGIPPEVRDRIFTPFFTTKSRGTGLGLSTAKRLIEAHRGRMAVTCPPGGGTIVTIELPL
jgi:PAS domain S-box-containing protein